MQATLQQKQAYLRSHIEPDHYQDFYEYCDKEIGSVDINGWTLSYVEQIVHKFNAHMDQERKNDFHEDHERSYYDYQSGANQDVDLGRNNNILRSIGEMDQTKSNGGRSSRVVKSSAVDLLDEAFQNTSINDTRSEKKNNNRSSVSFEEFDFWSSTMNGNNPKTETRPKYITSNQLYAQTPRHESQKQSNRHYDLMSGVGDEAIPKKQSPYLKKQPINQPIQIRKPAKSSIKLKEIKDIDGAEVKKIVPEISFCEQIPCFKSTYRSQLANPLLDVFIDKHEIIERSFLAPDYPMFNVKIIPFGTQCKRNFEDFSKLKSNLAKFYPGQHLPYLEESSWFSNTNTESINKHKKMLEFFLRDLLSNKQIRNSRVMQDFLNLQQHKQMKRKFEKYQKMDSLKGLQELCLLNGRVKVTLCESQKFYNENLKKFVDKMSDLFDKHIRVTEQLISLYHDIAGSLNSLRNIVDEMEREVKNFNKTVTTNEIRYLGEILKNVKETYKQDCSNMKFEYEIQSRKILPFVKYEQANMKELYKLTSANDRILKAFEKRSLVQPLSGQERYNSEETKGFKKGVLEESKNLTVLKYQAGFIGYQTRNEGQRVFDEMGVKILKRWQTLGECYLDKNTKSIDYWKSLLKIDAEKYKVDAEKYKIEATV